MTKKAKGKRQKAKGEGQKAHFYTFFWAAFVICVLCAVSFAQAVEKKPPIADVAPKVVQIDETQIAGILKTNGKPLLVNFWATWCVPCREEFPDLVEIDNEFKGRINVITISLDDPAEINRDVPKFLNEMKATMPTYLLYTNRESEVISSVSKDWQGGLPFSILYDEKGEVVHTKQGKIKPDVVKSIITKLVASDAAANVSNSEIIDLPVSGETFSYEKGVEDAKKDVADGKFKVKYYGLAPMATEESTDKLQQKYGIEIIYNGCLVSAGMIEYGKGYNEISRAAIKRKFDLDL